MSATKLSPPGPGSWHLDTSHLTTSCSRYQQPLWVEGFLPGFAGGLRRYGSLVASLDWAWIEGFPYYRVSPVAAPEGATEHPPREVWDELMATHPDVQERLATAERAFAERIWREDLQRWDEVDKPASIERNQRLLAVDPAALDTAGFLSYLEECNANVVECLYAHHIYNMTFYVPVGDLMVQGTALTGRSESEVLGLLKGSTPDALGTGHLEEALTRVAKQPDVKAILADDDAAALARIAKLDGEAGDVLREAVSLIAYRPVNGEDVGDTCAFELPTLVLAGISSRIHRPASDADEAAALAELESSMRADAEPSSRAQFDAVLEEARLTYRLREEKAMYADLWSYGVARRALLAGGERLVAAGRIEKASHLVEAELAEISAIFDKSGGPDPAELAERARYRAAVGFDAMPLHLGDEPGEPLPLEWLPPASARVDAAIGAALRGLFGPPGGESNAAIEGLGVSGGIVEGPARIIDASSDFDRIRGGDILVTRATTAALNVVIPLVKGIVTDRGGLLCHAAVVSREYSIPAVVGTGDATARIVDGARVRVDGAAGTVSVLDG